jgi:putative ABC transport system permease protein
MITGVMRLGILVRGIASRRGSAVVLFVASAVAVAAAAIGPIFLHAGDLSLLSNAFSAAPLGAPDVLVLANGGAGEFPRVRGAADDAVSRERGLLERPIFTVDSGSVFAGAGQLYGADVLARTGLCGHLRFTQGRCPTGADEVAISGRSAKLSGVGIGSHLALAPPRRSTSFPATVVGIYRQPATTHDSYWRGANYFIYGNGTPSVPQLDPLVSSFATALAYARVTPAQLAAEIPWSARAPLAGASALDAAVRGVKARIASDPSLQVSSGLGAILATANASAQLMQSIVLAIVLQLVFLVFLVLYALARAAAAGRSSEADFARRHGFTRASMFALAVGEPAALIVVALPAGLLAAWVFVVLVGRSLFAGGIPVTFDLLSIAAAIGVCAMGVLAVALASAELWRRDASSRSSVAVLALDISAIALALAGLLALATRGSNADALALLAPGLLALGAGVIAVRLAVVGIGIGICRTAESPRISSFLALRELGRRPAVLRQALPLAAAVTVCVFAIGGYARAASNRSLLAHFEVGADRVVTVSTKPGFDLASAVRRADPSGREAMAAVFYRSTYGELLAVDSSRLAAVATWPSGLHTMATEEIARRLTPPEPAPVTVRGDTVRLSASLPAGTPPMTLYVDLFDEVNGTTNTIQLGPIRPGTHTYSAPLDGACPGACRVVDLSPSWTNAHVHFPGTVRLSVRGFGSGPWGSNSPGVGITRSPGGVVFDLPGQLVGDGGLLLVPASNQIRVPAVVTTGLEAHNPPTPPGNSISLINLDGNPLNAKVIAAVPTLPLVGTNGAMVDLGLAQRELTGPILDATDQVWLTRNASPDILRRLRAMGVHIGPTRRAATLRASLDRSGPALGYELMLIVSPIAALLALGTIMFGIVSESRRRRGDLRALRVAGIAPRVVRRSLLLENLAVMTTALVVGVVVGVGALALALPSLPEFVNGTDALPVPTSVPLIVVGTAALALAVVFVVAAATTTRLALGRRTAGEGT